MRDRSLDGYMCYVRKLSNFKFNLIQKNNIIMIGNINCALLQGRHKHHVYHVDDVNQQGFDRKL
jgi:hypothetical protein